MKTHTGRRRPHADGAEIGVMLPQVKECLEPPEAGRGRKALPPELLEGTQLG